ncbi:rod shape-determining protein MreD [Candidatus Erwinia haradaeae]|uniref:Rod shape-determining protein MreD n=1 Tax=Candidatus Erwinia haradaeae TaxID=1922217 RepID=A0A451DA64_9GAMM|nr:rod shape-determining protein MreD [Candidatus Erwinia haradaeae]VFP83091.1 Rod shape-determining protein MreD [Candidatus Erwinia haradaeae]
MHDYYSHRYWIMWLSFLCTIMLQIIPCPEQFLLFRPSWLLLVMIYWILTFPSRINIGTGFIIGLIADLLYRSTLGIHALAFSMIAYLIAKKYYQFNSCLLWQQALLVIGLSWIMDVIIFLSEYFLIHVIFYPAHIWSSIINGILWPWIRSFMRKICHKFSIR